MSYTTRCPACGTTFKVVPDQLKISDGWVRCGHCADVFDATLYLETWVPPTPSTVESALADSPPPGADSTVVEGGAGRGAAGPVAAQARPAGPTADSGNPASPPSAPGPLQPDVRQPAEAAPLGNASANAGKAVPLPNTEKPQVDRVGESGPHALARSGVETPAVKPAEAEFLTDLQRFAKRSAADDAPARELPVRLPRSPQRSRPAAEPETPAPKESTATSGEASAARSPAGGVAPVDAKPPAERATPTPEARVPTSPTAAPESAAVAAEPEFIQKARRKAYWESPAMRATLMSGVLLLALLWLAQWSLYERNRLVAWRPALQPVFESACGVLGCAVEPVRSIDDIVIDSTALVRRLGNFYSFDLVLKNRSSIALAVPALELTLTDAAENVISRRVFLPQDMPGAPAQLAAGGSLSVSLRLSIAVGDSMPMSGYRALVFYP